MFVTLAVFGIVLITALPRFDRPRVHIYEAQRLVIANLRLARTNAITRNSHYQVEFPNADQILVERMKLVDGGWQIDPQEVRTIPLPTATQLAAKHVGVKIEFNTRGTAVNLIQPQPLDLSDTFGITKSVETWPSGQVNEL